MSVAYHVSSVPSYFSVVALDEDGNELASLSMSTKRVGNFTVGQTPIVGWMRRFEQGTKGIQDMVTALAGLNVVYRYLANHAEGQRIEFPNEDKVLTNQANGQIIVLDSMLTDSFVLIYSKEHSSA